MLFAQAMELAAGQADLIVIAGPEDGLAGLAAGYGAVPYVTVPGGPAHGGPAAVARVAAALIAAGAIGAGAVGGGAMGGGAVTGGAMEGGAVRDAELPGTGLGGVQGTEGTLAGRFLPRMREEETAGAGTTARSV